MADGAGLLVDPRQPEAIAAALDRVLGDEALGAALGEIGLGRAAEYTWERTAERTASAYAEAARGSG